ncbi:nuclear transport factor 2 family protein [Agromyces sp. SYSU T00194]|uniref:nuclear transport factor 2 family protein n=1 Tax=Agromyces chitinivorans TaxID=3158560 RepID=UPI0033953576
MFAATPTAGAPTTSLRDRAEIAEVLSRYSQGVDQRRWDLFASAFAPGARIRMTLFPGRSYTAAEFRGFLADGYDGVRLSGQHALANPLVTFADDQATSAVEFLATTLEATGADGRTVRGTAAGLYLDRWTRTDAGWRIRERLLVLKTLDERPVEPAPALRDAILGTRDAFVATGPHTPIRFLEGDPMPLTPDDLAARAEIHDVLIAYCQAQDQELWSLWDRVFTPDATVRMPGVTDAAFTPDQLQGFLRQFNATRVSGQHTVSNVLVDLDGDTARTVSELTAVTLQTTDREGVLKRSRSAGLYVDDFVRTDEGWRIRSRTTLQKLVEIDDVEYDPALIATFALSKEHGFTID